MTRKKKINSENGEHNNHREMTDNEDNNSLNDNDLNNTGEDQMNKSLGEDLIPQSEEIVEESEKPADKELPKEITAEEKLADMQDRYLRLSADFDNYRKRTLKEKMELTKSAGECILLNIIPVMDDFERALKLMETTTDCVGMKNGIDLIYSKFRDFLKQNNLKEIDSLNSAFNVDLHEAISKIPVQEENKKGKVIEVIEKGYYLNNKVIRFAKVIVGE
jgi:molecular chaperone GrpE